MSLFRTPTKFAEFFNRLSGHSTHDNVLVGAGAILNDSNVTKRKHNNNKIQSDGLSNINLNDSRNGKNVTIDDEILLSPNENVVQNEIASFELSSNDFVLFTQNNQNDENSFCLNDHKSIISELSCLKNEIESLKNKISNQQTIIDTQHNDIIELRGMFAHKVHGNSSISKPVTSDHLQITNEMKFGEFIRKEIRKFQAELVRFDDRLNENGDIFNRCYSKIDLISNNFCRDVDTLSSYCEKLNGKCKKMENSINGLLLKDKQSEAELVNAVKSGNAVKNTSLMVIDAVESGSVIKDASLVMDDAVKLGNMDKTPSTENKNNNVQYKNVNNSKVLTNFESNYVSFSDNFCGNVLNCDGNVESCSIKIKILKFKSFSGNIKIRVDIVGNSLRDNIHNVNLIKSRILEKINVINSFKICCSIDKIFTNRTVYIGGTDHNNEGLIGFIIFFVNVDFPLNFQFFDMDNDLVRIDGINNCNESNFFRKFN